jgi:hypothetical protein
MKKLISCFFGLMILTGCNSRTADLDFAPLEQISTQSAIICDGNCPPQVQNPCSVPGHHFADNTTQVPSSSATPCTLPPHCSFCAQ